MKNILIWVLIPSFCGAVAYGLISLWPSSDPSIEYPSHIDLGEHELGDQAVGRFTIANRGGSDLFLDQVHTNCSCSGLERETNGQYAFVDKLRLHPGQSADLVMRVSVRGGPAGEKMVNVVTFRTNDPSVPLGRIEAVVSRVSGGVFASPPVVAFGAVPVGAEVRRFINVLDKAKKLRSVGKVTTVDSRLDVRLLPAEDQSSIARLEIVVKTDTPGEVNATVQIHLAGENREPDVVSVVGRVVAPLEVIPSALFLPRQSSSGPVYTADCLLRGSGDMPSFDPPPAGVRVQTLSGGVIRVSCDPPDAMRVVTLRFRTPEGVTELAVTLRPRGE